MSSEALSFLGLSADDAAPGQQRSATCIRDGRKRRDAHWPRRPAGRSRRAPTLMEEMANEKVCDREAQPVAYQDEHWCPRSDRSNDLVEDSFHRHEARVSKGF